jgi:Endoplasmic Reticulum-Golgi Intermediate Compartment (ERGIC)
MSVVAGLLALALLTRELQYSMAVRTTTNLEVDSRFDPAGRRTNVTFDVKFPSIACDHISISAEDNNGAPQVGGRRVHVCTRALCAYATCVATLLLQAQAAATPKS